MSKISVNTRKWIYGLAIPASLLLVAYGVLDQEHAQLWLNLLAALLAVGPSALALANTPSKAEVEASTSGIETSDDDAEEGTL